MLDIVISVFCCSLSIHPLPPISFLLTSLQFTLYSHFLLSRFPLSLSPLLFSPIPSLLTSLLCSSPFHPCPLTTLTSPPPFTPLLSSPLPSTSHHSPLLSRLHSLSHHFSTYGALGRKMALLAVTTPSNHRTHRHEGTHACKHTQTQIHIDTYIHMYTHIYTHTLIHQQHKACKYSQHLLPFCYPFLTHIHPFPSSFSLLTLPPSLYVPHPFQSISFFLSPYPPSLLPLPHPSPHHFPPPASLSSISMPSMPPLYSNRYTMPDTSLKLMKVHVRSTKKYVTISDYHHHCISFIFQITKSSSPILHSYLISTPIFTAPILFSSLHSYSHHSSPLHSFHHHSTIFLHHYQVREAQLAQYNFILVVGEKEMEAHSVNIRTRENEV